MSQRVCFIGDSHVAALRLALMSEKFAARRGDVTIYGTIRSTLSGLALREGKLTSDAEEVREALRFTGGSEESTSPPTTSSVSWPAGPISRLPPW